MRLTNKTALVTGASGFIGRRLLASLHEKGANVIAIDKTVVNTPFAKSFMVDLARPQEVLRRVCEASDIIFHLAAYSSAHMFHEFGRPFKYNVELLLQILDCAASTSRKIRFVFPSSSTVYAGNPAPWREDVISNVAVNWYAASKITGELLCRHYANRYPNIETAILRIFCGYGPGEMPKGPYASPATLFAWNMLRGKPAEIWGDGKQERDLVYIDDIVEALILAATSRLDGDTFNVGTGVPTSFLALVSQINEILGKDIAPKFVQSRMHYYLQKTLADTTRTEKVLGFKPKTSLKEGLAKTVASLGKLDIRRSSTHARLTNLLEH